MANIRLLSVNSGSTGELSNFEIFECFFKSCGEIPNAEIIYDTENNCIKLTLNEDAEITFNFSDRHLYIDDTVVVNRWFLSGHNTILLACSDTACYIKIRNDAGAIEAGRLFHYLYEIIEDEFTGEEVAYDGYYFSDSQYTPWENVKMSAIAVSQRGEDADDTQYTHKPMLEYKAPFKAVDYTYSYFINGNTISNIEDTNFMTCSTVSSDSIISFDGINYYALDTNTLMEIDIEHDDEEDEEE